MGSVLSQGLLHLHSTLRTMHRDVKPENIMLRDGDPARPVLIDYGLARRIAPDVPSDAGSDVPYSGLQRTYSGNVGTPGFEAPEVLQVTVNGKPGEWNMPGFIKVPGMDVEAVYGRKVDVWSLGACLYYALSGVEPGKYDNPTLQEYTKRCREGFYQMDIPPLCGTNVPLKQTIQAMMNVDVERRLTMEAVAQRLAALVIEP